MTKNASKDGARSQPSDGHREDSQYPDTESSRAARVRRESGYHRRVQASSEKGQGDDAEGAGDTSRQRRPWSLVEEFEHEGHLYRLMRRPLDHSRTLRLTNRERQAVQLASEGNGRPEIADALGVSPSTVGVLLHRACVKFDVRTKKEMIERFREEQLAPPSRRGR